MSTKQERINLAVNKIINLFQKGNVPESIAIVTFPPFDVPSCKWSISNRIIMVMSGTSDARGFKQWQQMNRHVKPKEKAFYILGPRMVKKESEDAEGNQEDQYVLAGFIPIPVFAVEQTEGEELSYEKIELPEFPLMDKAREWRIDVKGIAFQGRFLGYYQDGCKKEEIRLATPHEKTFFHELAHAAHKRVVGNLQPGQNPKQEIVAELAAQTLAQLVGTEMESTIGNSYKYIKKYADILGKDIGLICLGVLADTEKVLQLILSEEQVPCSTQ